MAGQGEDKPEDIPVQDARPARASLADLLAFLGVLVLAGALVLLVDRGGQQSVRLAFAAAAGLVVACVNAWRRLRRVELRRWRSGQVTYHGRRVTLVSAWGVEGQPLTATAPVPAIEPSASTNPATPTRTEDSDCPVHMLPPECPS